MNDPSTGSGSRPLSAACNGFGDPLAGLNRLLIRALKDLAEKGEADLACRIAAEAWSCLRRDRAEEAAKLNGALHYLTRLSDRPKKEIAMSTPQELDVRDLPPAKRHALIFDSCEKLLLGDALILVNDHDPRPLYYQFEAETPGQFGWQYLEKGPAAWRVRITRQKAL